MRAERHPNVLYVGQNVQWMVFEPIQLALWNLTNLRSTLVSAGRTEQIRGKVATRLQRSRPNPLFRRVLFEISLLTHRYAERLDLGTSPTKEVEPDLIFVAEAYRKIEGLDKFSCPKAYYAQDPHLSIKRYFDLAHVEDYDFVFVTQRDALPIFREKGCKRVIWLPWAFDPAIVLGPPESRVHDIAFVGNPYPGSQRDALLKSLEQRFPVFRSRVYARDMARVLRGSKIVFNKSFNGDLNPRNFEAMAAGALLVTDRIGNGLFDLFQEKVHLVTYGDASELVQVIDYYLKHDSERESIASRGQQEVISHHTYLHRASEVVRTCLGIDLSAEVQEMLAGLKDAQSLAGSQ